MSQRTLSGRVRILFRDDGCEQIAHGTLEVMLYF